MLEQDGVGATVYARTQDAWSVLVLKPTATPSTCRKSASPSPSRNSTKASHSRQRRPKTTKTIQRRPPAPDRSSSPSAAKTETLGLNPLGSPSRRALRHLAAQLNRARHRFASPLPHEDSTPCQNSALPTLLPPAPSSPATAVSPPPPINIASSTPIPLDLPKLKRQGDRPQRDLPLRLPRLPSARQPLCRRPRRQALRPLPLGRRSRP